MKTNLEECTHELDSAVFTDYTEVYEMLNGCGNKNDVLTKTILENNEMPKNDHFYRGLNIQLLREHSDPYSLLSMKKKFYQT